MLYGKVYSSLSRHSPYAKYVNILGFLFVFCLLLFSVHLPGFKCPSLPSHLLKHYPFSDTSSVGTTPRNLLYFYRLNWILAPFIAEYLDFTDSKILGGLSNSLEHDGSWAVRDHQERSSAINLYIWTLSECSDLRWSSFLPSTNASSWEKYFCLCASVLLVHPTHGHAL